jgi:hypothetical protein
MKVKLTKITIQEIKNTCLNITQLNDKEKAKFLYLAIENELVDEVKILLSNQADIYYPINDSNSIEYARRKIFFTQPQQCPKRFEIVDILNMYEEKLKLENSLSLSPKTTNKVKI